MKLLGSTKIKITKDKNDEDVPYLEIYEVALIHYNLVNNSYQQNFICYIHLFLINLSINYQIFHPKISYFKKHLIQDFCMLEYGFQIKILIL